MPVFSGQPWSSRARTDGGPGGKSGTVGGTVVREGCVMDASDDRL